MRLLHFASSEGLMIKGLAEDAIDEICERLEGGHNGGKRFPPRTTELAKSKKKKPKGKGKK